ncbi:MAG: hypothetical protein AAF363_17795 [Bacteroidota bacterium]
MITTEQYEFFQSLYEKENKRAEELMKKSQIYLSIESFVLTALFFKVNDLQTILSDECFLKSLYIVSISFIFLALFATVLSIKIYKYERVEKPKNVLSQFGKTAMPNGDFFLRRIVDYSVAAERNYEVNEKKARFLELSVIFIGLGFLFSLIFLIVFAL